MLRIGLTGGVASGKSLVAARFAEHGIEVIDADLIARELAQPGQAAHRRIVTEFGPSVLAADGHIERRRLRRLVFSDPESRRKLEAILHPLVYRRMEELARRSSGPYLVLVVPLLVETGYIGFCDRVLVIDAPPALQLERLMQRDGIDAAEASAMLAAQADRATRLAAADDRIDNSGDIRHLLAQTDGFHRMYSELARARDPTP
jgi:dephospho-CoA kinase